nr:MAG TPA: hypothetical protein [Caudoviricetes sp.]DAN61668.1 MAG TPA: hypothetical protein [Caudoviricetes sp.]DAU28586.1 MAG TPA: hypothetical protein [Caudoviricetes sp.]
MARINIIKPLTRLIIRLKVNLVIQPLRLCVETKEVILNIIIF